MSNAVNTKHVGIVEGFDIDAKIVADIDTRPDDFDCFSPEDIAAWERDEWSYVGTIVTASKAGVKLGESSLWGSEYGYLPGIEGHVSPLNGDGDEFINGYGNDLIAEAVEAAKSKLAELLP